MNFSFDIIRWRKSTWDVSFRYKTTWRHSFSVFCLLINIFPGNCRLAWDRHQLVRRPWGLVSLYLPLLLLWIRSLAMMIPTRPQGHHHHNYWPSLSTRSLKTLSPSSITITTTAAMTTTITKVLSLLSGLRKWFEGNVLGGKQLSPWTQVFVFWAIQFFSFSKCKQFSHWMYFPGVWW